MSQPNHGKINELLDTLGEAESAATDLSLTLVLQMSSEEFDSRRTRPTSFRLVPEAFAATPGEAQPLQHPSSGK